MGGLTKLGDLRLLDLKIKKPDLTFLENLPGLSQLTLRGKWVADAGFEHIGGFKHLGMLSLPGTGMTDADLQHLKGLSSLEYLDLSDNRITDAGLEHLHGLKSLRILWIDKKLHGSQGLAKLKQAIPALEVREW
jgi:hypothetical protein